MELVFIELNFFFSPQSEKETFFSPGLLWYHSSNVSNFGGSRVAESGTFQ